MSPACVNFYWCMHPAALYITSNNLTVNATIIFIYSIIIIIINKNNCCVDGQIVTSYACVKINEN
jgi:hypothetical protein